MSDVAGAAPAAAESLSAPIPEVVDTPNPISTEGEPTPDPKPEKTEKGDKPLSTREALLKAQEKVEADNKPKPEAKAAAKTEAKPDAKEPPKADEGRDPKTGQFASKDKPAIGAEKTAGASQEKPETAAPAKSSVEAPKRFTEDARKVWDTAPDPVKHEVARMERELTAGIEKHRQSAEKYESVRQFDELAAKSGTTLPQALARYVGIEQKLRGDLVGGLDEIISNASQGKLSLRDVAAHIMGQTPEQTQSASDATIRELKATVAQLQEQVGGVTETIKTQRETSTLQEINKFAADHPRFEDLADDIAFFMKSGRAKDLSEAYQLAERLNPAPASATADDPSASDAAAAKPDLAEQIRKGTKSPSGAPATGSDPVSERPSKTAREAVQRAMRRAG